MFPRETKTEYVSLCHAVWQFVWGQRSQARVPAAYAFDGVIPMDVDAVQKGKGKKGKGGGELGHIKCHKC